MTCFWRIKDPLNSSFSAESIDPLLIPFFNRLFQLLVRFSEVCFIVAPNFLRASSQANGSSQWVNHGICIQVVCNLYFYGADYRTRENASMSPIRRIRKLLHNSQGHMCLIFENENNLFFLQIFLIITQMFQSSRRVNI